MIIGRFTVQCHPNRSEEMAAVIRLVEAGAFVREMEWTVWEATGQVRSRILAA